MITVSNMWLSFATLIVSVLLAVPGVVSAGYTQASYGPINGPYSGIGTQATNAYGTADCADGIDNDADALVDYPADTSCTNAADDEAGAILQCYFTGCPAGYQQQGQSCIYVGCPVCGTGVNLNRVVDSCNGNQVIQDCTANGPGWTCNAAACVPPPAAIIDITADGERTTLIRYDGSVQITWSAQNVISCQVTDDNPDITTSCGTGWCTSSGNMQVTNIQQRTRFTLTCVAQAGGNVSRVTTVNVAPRFREL